MSYSISDFFDQSNKHLLFFDNQISDYQKLIQQNKECIENLEAQRKQVILRMVQVTAPNFSVEELQQLGKLLHNDEVSSLALKLIDMTTTSQKRLEEINANQEYIERHILIDEKTGDYILELKQLTPVYNKMAKEFAPFKKYTLEFEDLIEDRYGLPDYEHKSILRFFNGEHLDNWRIGDILCEEFGVEEFLPLRSQYIEKKTAIDKMFEAVKHYQQKITFIQDLIKEHAEITAKLPKLPVLYRQQLGLKLDAFLTSTSTGSIAAFFAAYPALASLSKTQQGLNAQRQYLSDFRIKLKKELDELLAKKGRLEKERHRYKSNPHKYRSKTWFKSKFQKRFRRNTEWTKKRYKKYQKVHQVIYDFDNYDSINIAATDVFWWGVITKEKLDGSFSPSVQHYYESNTHDSSTYYTEVTNNIDRQPRSYSSDES